MAGACGRSNRSQSKAMIFSSGVSRTKIISDHYYLYQNLIKRKNLFFFCLNYYF
jgi:hypothetical protein